MDGIMANFVQQNGLCAFAAFAQRQQVMPVTRLSKLPSAQQTFVRLVSHPSFVQNKHQLFCQKQNINFFGKS